ncbi:hypothetical protein RB653_000102 [Dictyostelium firmibasis]|uniref:Uncharacterized protein n=1 Tax=Dictyostelium firmibasis TaxID=79012 RepID=A0AAN7TUL8_9MYCE
MSDINERKQAIYEKFQKVINENNEKERLKNQGQDDNKKETNVNKNNQNEDKDVQEIINKRENNSSGNHNNDKLESEILLEKRRVELEKEIKEINEVLNRKGNVNLGKPKLKEPWYEKYPTANALFSHPDFHDWQKFTSLMSIAGLVMGGLHGYSEGKKYIRDSIAKSVHSPLSISSVQLNQRKTLGIMVFRSSLIFSYRCGLYTATFLGTEYLLKNNVFGEGSLLNRTLAGTAIGALSAFHMRKRGNLVVPLSICMGTTIGFVTGCADLLVDKSFRKIEEFTRESENK